MLVKAVTEPIWAKHLAVAKWAQFKSTEKKGVIKAGTNARLQLLLVSKLVFKVEQDLCGKITKCFNKSKSYLFS